MSLTDLILSEASAFDLLEAVSDTGAPMRLTRLAFGRMARQAATGATVAIREADGALVIVAGLWPEGDHAEAWFAVGPALRPNLRRALRLVETLMAVTCREACVAEVRTYTAPNSVAGPRLAAVLGFEALGLDDGPTGAQLLFIRRFP